MRNAVLPLPNGSHARPKRGAARIPLLYTISRGNPGVVGVMMPFSGSPLPGMIRPASTAGVTVCPVIGLMTTLTPLIFAGRYRTVAFAGLNRYGTKLPALLLFGDCGRPQVKRTPRSSVRRLLTFQWSRTYHS